MTRFSSQFLASNKHRWLLGSAALLLLIVLAFDWDWFRPALQHYLIQKSHRLVKIGHLDVNFSISLQPTVRLKDLYIENAAWSSKRPLIAVKEISFTFATFKMLFEEFRLISLITISEGEVNLEALENGLRNWRLQNPEDRGPGQYLVMAVNVHKAAIRLTNRALQLEVTARSNPWVADSLTDKAAGKSTTNVVDTANNMQGQQLTKQLTFTGHYRGNDFSGNALTGTTWQLQKTGEVFPLQANVVSGKTRFDIHGLVADILRDQMVDADMHIATPSASRLNAFLPYRLPDTHTIDSSLHLRKSGQNYYATHMQTTLGNSQLSGNLAYLGNGAASNREKPLWQGRLTSKTLNLDDITSINTGAASNTDELRQQQNKQNHKDHNKAGHRLFSAKALTLESMNTHDVDIQLDIAKLLANNKLPLEDVKITARLNEGILKFNPLQAKLAGGTFYAELTLDSQQQPAIGKADIHLKGIALQTLLKGTAQEALVSAPLSGNLQLQGAGNSLAEIMGHADGKLQLALGSGSISNKLDAKLGLDGGKLLWLSLRGDKAITVHCANMQFHFKQGIGIADKLLLNSAQTYLMGTGTINLRDERLNLLIIPTPKDPTIFSLSSAINIQGPIAAPSYTLEKKSKANALAFPINSSDKSGC